MTPDAKELSDRMSIWDQTVGCDHCQMAWWAENNTDDPTLFHLHTCPLFGRRDVAEHWFNLDYIESELGYTVGCDGSEDDKLAAREKALETKK